MPTSDEHTASLPALDHPKVQNMFGKSSSALNVSSGSAQVVRSNISSQRVAEARCLENLSCRVCGIWIKAFLDS